MLVLSRKQLEVICITAGTVEIEIHVCKIGPEKVRIGVNAPKGVAVHRKEVYDAIKREQVIEETRRIIRESE